MTRVSDEGDDQHGEGTDGLTPQLVDAAAVEQAVDAGRGRRSVAEEARWPGCPEAADEVHADDVERVVEAELELQADGQGAEHTGERRRRMMAPTGRDRGAGRGDGDQAGDDAGGGAERGGVAVADLLREQPAEHGGAGGDHAC